MNEGTLTKNSEDLIRERFPVGGMSCAACASSVESILSNTEGVREAKVNFADNTVVIEYQAGIPEQKLQEALRSVGYDLIIDRENQSEKQEDQQQEEYQNVKSRLIWSAVLTVPVFVTGMFFPEWAAGRWISMLLTTAILFYFGKNFFVNAWKQARFARANMDTLVALSTGIAFLISLFNTFYPEFWTTRGFAAHVYYETAAVIITFITLGKLLEARAKSNTSAALKKLMGLQPKSLTVLKNDEVTEILLSQVMPGDTVVIKPGERIPVDGVLLAGESFVDESLVTGEPLPVKKSRGDEVFSGTINQKGSFRFRAKAVGSETLLSRIIEMVREAQGSKAPVQKLVDKIAAVFVPVVMGISIVTFLVWLLAGGPDAFTHALLTSIAVLVIACPCALGLATPTAIMVGVGKGAANNILIRDAESLEQAHQVDAVILDKTGTITAGKPTVVDISWSEHADPEELKAVLLAMESRSEHPLGEAISRYLREAGVKESENITSFTSLTGEGIRATVNGGRNYAVGSLEFVHQFNLALGTEEKSLGEQWQREAKTVVYFVSDSRLLAMIAIADEIKQGSAEAIESLVKKGLEVYMLTGDSEATAEAVARATGIEHYRARTMPADKAEFVKLLQEKGKKVAMVGDGINDSQALAEADISIAMGHGSDIAMDVARMTLITSDLRSLPRAFRLSKITVRGIRQNLFWAFIYNIIGIPVAAGVLYPINGFLLDPMIAGAAMAFSSVSVVANSLRLRGVKL